MRGSISNDGFSEALSQEEEDRPQAMLPINRLEVGAISMTWYLPHTF